MERELISIEELREEAKKQGKTLCENETCLIKQPHWHPRPQASWPTGMGSAVTPDGLLTYSEE